MSEQHHHEVLVHGGFEAFLRGRFEDAGGNLYVRADGLMETIHRTDVNGDGYVDIVIPNDHGYTERGPTWIYRLTPGSGQGWERQELPNDSGWLSRVVDVDGDGYLDLIVVNGENGVTSELTSFLYWGGSTGLTGERTEFATAGAYDVAVVDVDGDGRLDLVFPSAWQDHHNPGQPRPMQVFLQQTGRRFEDATAHCGLTCIAATSVACGDLNGDGRADLVVANYRCGFEYDFEAWIYWSAPGGFDVARPTRLPTHYAQQALLADLDGDGCQEVIFCGGNQVWIYWNRQGRLTPQDCTILEAPGFQTMFCIGAVRAAVADVDGDGAPELILATVDGIQIRSARDLQTVRTLLPLTNATFVSAADLDGDGRPEIIASRYEDGVSYDTHSAIYWNGPHGFCAERVTLLPTGGAMGNTAGDLDGDGRPEVIFNCTMGGPSVKWKDFPIYVYLGNERGEYSAERRLVLPTGGSSMYVAADLDQDGYADLAVTTQRGLRVFHGGPDGLRPERYTDLTMKGAGTQQLLVADFNRDGYLDLMAIAITYDDKPETLAHSSVIFWGSGAGFHSDRYSNLPTFSGGLAQLADVNRDGWLDLILSEWGGSVLIYWGGADGFARERTCRVKVGTAWVGSINVADLNKDGWPDLIVDIMGHYTRSPETVAILYGGPEGYTLERAQLLAAHHSPAHSGVADLNGDGNLDLVLAAYSSTRTRVLPVQIFWGDGQRIDLEHPTELPAESASATFIVDLDRDGRPDLVLACHRDDLGHQSDSRIYWNGPGGLSPERYSRLPSMGPHRLCARDFGNWLTREPVEYYVSPPFDIAGRTPVRLAWDATVQDTTALKLQLRWAGSEVELDEAPWHGPAGEGGWYEESGAAVKGVATGARWVQYRAAFVSLYGVKSAQLRQVRIELAPAANG